MQGTLLVVDESVEDTELEHKHKASSSSISSRVLRCTRWESARLDSVRSLRFDSSGEGLSGEFRLISLKSEKWEIIVMKFCVES